MIDAAGPKHLDPRVYAAVETLRAHLPHTDPHRVWRNHELTDEEGRRYHIDLLILTLNGLWLIHVDPTEGTLEDDDTLWRWDDTRTVTSPRTALHATATVIRERLDIRRPDRQPVPLHTAILLAGSVRVKRARPDLYVLGDHPDVPNLLAGLVAPPVPAEAVIRASTANTLLGRLGHVAHADRRVVKGWTLGELLEDHHVWQEHAATHPEHGSGRVRTWIPPRASTPDQRAVLARAARTEAGVLARLGEHRSILGLHATDFSRTPRLVFEGFDGLPLDKHLRAHPQLPFETRLALLLEIGDALSHCHRQDVLHRNLSPASILVAPDSTRIRLHRFEGALTEGTHLTKLGTRHLTAFSERIDELYRAWEVFQSPTDVDSAADLFSLGAIAWFLFTGRHPGPTIQARRKQIDEDEGLHLWREINDADDTLDHLIGQATRLYPYERTLDDAPLTVDRFLTRLRAHFRHEDAPVVDPLVATVGDRLPATDGELQVTAVLGTGATARVLQVQRDGATYALKLPLLPRYATHLEAEATALRRADHPHVVILHGTPVIGDTTGLLLQFAGTTSLSERVRAEGSLSLDYCARLGEQLLSAVAHLHDRGIFHRDLKPANLAFASTGNQANKLVVFDFSLTAIDPSQLTAGTPGWRDPFLGGADRPGWDAQADLYGAAACLYYALTGDRPRVAMKGPAAGTVPVQPARFDPSLRGALESFFTRAFAPTLADRHPDADAILAAWTDLFAEDTTTVTTDPAVSGPDLLDRARLDTPVARLGLSARAVDGLERAGVFDVRDLLALPRNRLSAVRGVGHDTARQIHDVRARLHKRLGDRGDTEAKPFLPELPGLPVSLVDAELPLDDAARTVLADAGLRTTHDLAHHPHAALVRLLGLDRTATRALQQALRATAPAAALTGTLAGWVKTLLSPRPPSKRPQWQERLEALVGLAPLDGDTCPLGGRTNAFVANALGLTPVVFRSTFQGIRKVWNKPEVRPIAEQAANAVRDAVPGPVARLEDVARHLVATHAPPHLAHDGDTLRQAAALIRFATELDIPHPPLAWKTLAGAVWVADDAATLEALARAAAALDSRIDGPPLPPDAALEHLAPHTEGTALARLAPSELLAIVCGAATHAAVSARGEVYPRGMLAERAVALAAGVLQGELTPDEVHKRVRGRYPDAAAPPDRPALDALLAPLGLTWSDDRRRYLRPGTAKGSLSRSRATFLTRSDTASAPAIKAERFRRDLHRSLQAGGFRALQVGARDAERARELLASEFGMQVTSLDAEIHRRLLARVDGTQGAQLDPILGVERTGPGGPHWATLLRAFLHPVLDELITEVLARRDDAAQLLVHPGLLARYEARTALDRLVREASDSGTGAVWLLLPSYDDAGHPVVVHPLGNLPVPTTRPAQAMRVPKSWLHAERAR